MKSNSDSNNNDSNNNIVLQLGDLIKLISPTNPEYHENVYLIDFINNEKITLATENKKFTLDVNEEGKILEESIELIELLYRQSSPSYIIQNGLEIDKVLSIYFGGSLPFVLNGKITNIEEDMIELKIIPTNEIYYIDFGYSGIPEELNIEKIIINNEFDGVDEFLKEEDIKKELVDEEFNEKDLESGDNYDLDLDINPLDDDYKKVIIDDIIFDNLEEVELVYNVNVEEGKKRYTIEDQLNDYLDNELINYKSSMNYDKFVNNINLEINRYKELRSLYSNFDNNNNPIQVEEKNEFYKPIKDVLQNLNKKLHWLLPITNNKKFIFNNEEIKEIEDDEYIQKIELSDFINDLNKITNSWINNNSKDKINDYKSYINSLLNIYETNINKYDNSTKVNTRLDVINHIQDDFYSFTIKNNNISKERFITDVYSNGIKMLEQYYINNKKSYKLKELTQNDSIYIIGFLVLPLPIFNFSCINGSYTNIYDITNLSTKYVNYSKILNKSTNVDNYITDTFGYKDTNNTIHSNNLFESTKAFFMNIKENTSNEEYINEYDNLLESFIETNTSLIEKISNNYKLFNFNDFVKFGQNLNIDLYNINILHYNQVSKIIQNNINNYKSEYKLNRISLDEEIDILNKDINDENVISNFDILNPNIKSELFELYNINNIDKSNEEILNEFIRIDNGKFFMKAVNKNIMDLIVSNLLDNFIKQSKLLKKDAQQSGNAEDNLSIEDKDDSTCEKYFLSKKYQSMEEMENDNNKLIFFDAIYDTTYYSLSTEFSKEKQSMDTKDYFDFLVQNIMDKMSMTKKQASREAKAIIEEKREVIEGDYAVLIDKESNKNYIYIRNNNIWELDENFKNDFYIDTNKILCNINKDCISKDDKCMTNSKNNNKLIQSDVDKILESFHHKYNIGIEEIKKDITNQYENQKSILKNIVKLNNEKKEKLNNILLNYQNEEEEANSLSVSPYEKLRDKILQIKDISKKYHTLKNFCLKFTRESIMDENNNWLYCNITSVKLVPLFMLKLANTFLNKGDYLTMLDSICADQGTISDDNNYWVDKHSGYIIKSIDFNSDEGYDEKGFKLYTKELLEDDVEFSINLFNKPLSGDSIIIHAIINAITQMIGINLKEHYEFIINNVTKIQKQSVPSKLQYENLIIKTNKQLSKPKEFPSYEDTCNLSLLTLTLTFIIISIQISIPSIKSKKTFPGCIKSFDGYPLSDNENKSSITYICCVANKLKSSIKPWNTLMKMSETSLIKKIDAIINKFIINDKFYTELINKKREYLRENPEKDFIMHELGYELDIFCPPLVNINVDINNTQPLSSTFKTNMLDDIKKGRKTFHYENLISKMTFLGNNIIENIQNVISKDTLLLNNNNGEPYLENACCSNINKIYDFLVQKDKSIYEINTLVKNYSEFLSDFNDLKSARILFDNNNTKISFEKLPQDYNEVTIYKAFIYFCNFDNDLPISDELKGVCYDKPIEFNASNSIEENIEELKTMGKVYNKESLNNLLSIISKKNLIILNNQVNTLNNVEKIRILLDNYSLLSEEYNIDELFITNLKNIIDSYSLTSSNNESIRTMKNYLGSTNNVTRKIILDKLKTIPGLSKPHYKLLEDTLTFKLEETNLYVFKDYLFNFVNIYSNIVLNKNINYNAIPEHWNISDTHIKDVYNIIKNFYSGLIGIKESPGFDLIFKIIKNKYKILFDLIELILYNKPIVIDKEKDIKLNSIFDLQFLELFYNYCFLTLISELLMFENNDQFILEITEYDDYSSESLNKSIIDYIIEFVNIFKNYENLFNNSYKKIKDKISIAKEKEKDLITGFLEKLSEEEREIETIFKNNKLEKWSKGLQKGLTQYVKENYDEERMELEKQALKEKLVNKKDFVTDMNKEIYKLDIEEEMRNEEEMDKEAYDMNNIPDDSDYESDYEFD